jgi:hypothetical protein
MSEFYSPGDGFGYQHQDPASYHSNSAFNLAGPSNVATFETSTELNFGEIFSSIFNPYQGDNIPIMHD